MNIYSIELYNVRSIIIILLPFHLQKWPPEFSAYLSFVSPKRDVLSSTNESSPSHSFEHDIPLKYSHNVKEEPLQKPSEKTNNIKTNNTISLFGFFVKLLQYSVCTFCDFKTSFSISSLFVFMTNKLFFCVLD